MLTNFPPRPASERPEDRNSRFVRLLTRNERRVYAYILSLVPDWSDADEILQETSIRLWEQFDRFEVGSDFGAWACTIARYQVLTHRKKQARSKLVFSDEFLSLVEEEHNAQPDVLDDRREALERCLDLISDRNRQLLRLCYEPNATVAGVAKQVGRTVASTYKTLQRVRLALHDCINNRLAMKEGQ